MTPLEYARKYWDLDIPLEDGTLRVCVKSYVSGCHGSPLLTKAQTLVDQQDELLTVSVKTVFGNLDQRSYDKLTRKKLNGMIQDPFNGKGSPEEIQALMQVAVKCGFLQRHEVAAFCASGKIGLDCCGFVSNYVWHAVMRRPWDVDVGKKDAAASNYIPSMMLAGRALKTEDELSIHRAQCLVLATADENGRVIPNGAGAHIMITEPHTLIRMSSSSFVATSKGKSSFEYAGQSYQGRSEKVCDGSTFVVVESTGGLGLVSSRYRLLSVDEKTGVFKVGRGCKSGTLHVRIATLAA